MSGHPHEHSLGDADHDDIELASPANGEALVYESSTSKWKNKKTFSRPRARIYQGVALSLVNNVWTQITLNTATYDTHSMCGTNKLTVPTGQGGLYHIIGSVGFTANATGRRNVGLKVGAGWIAQARPNNNGADHAINNVSDVRELSEGDEITLWAQQACGGNLLTKNDQMYTFLVAVRLD